MENLKKFHRVIACFISFVILSSSYIPAIGIYDMFSGDIDEVYKTSGVCEYYNLIAMLPVKIVTKFVLEKTNASKISDAKKTAEKNGKKKSSRNNNFDIAFTGASSNEKVSSAGGCNAKYKLIALNYEFDSYSKFKYFEPNAVFLVFMMVLCFCFYARGDTEDSIINNINTQKFRLG